MYVNISELNYLKVLFSKTLQIFQKGRFESGSGSASRTRTWKSKPIRPDPDPDQDSDLQQCFCHNIFRRRETFFGSYFIVRNWFAVVSAKCNHGFSP